MRKSKVGFVPSNDIDSRLFLLEDKPYLEFLLSIAVGSQLADVFLHLLPEAFAHPHASSIHIGLWTLVGLFVFFLIEQVFPEDQRDDDDNDDQTFTEDRSDAVKILSTRPSLIVELQKNNAAIVRRQNPIKVMRLEIALRFVVRFLLFLLDRQLAT